MKARGKRVKKKGSHGYEEEQSRGGEKGEEGSEKEEETFIFTPESNRLVGGFLARDTDDSVSCSNRVARLAETRRKAAIAPAS
jgi:hypothetical protein